MTILGTGIALAAVILTTHHATRTEIGGLRNEIAELRNQVNELRERMARLEGLFEGFTKGRPEAAE